MKRLMLILVVCATMSGCVNLGQYTLTGEEGESASVILAVTNNNPVALGKALLIINLAGLEKGTYTGADAVEALNEVKSIVEEGITYLNLEQYLSTKLALASVLILGTDIGSVADLGGDGLISDYDKNLIISHINQQIAIANLY